MNQEEEVVSVMLDVFETSGLPYDPNFIKIFEKEYNRRFGYQGLKKLKQLREMFPEPFKKLRKPCYYGTKLYNGKFFYFAKVKRAKYSWTPHGRRFDNFEYSKFTLCEFDFITLKIKEIEKFAVRSQMMKHLKEILQNENKENEQTI